MQILVNATVHPPVQFDILGHIDVYFSWSNESSRGRLCKLEQKKKSIEEFCLLRNENLVGRSILFLLVNFDAS